MSAHACRETASAFDICIHQSICFEYTNICRKQHLHLSKHQSKHRHLSKNYICGKIYRSTIICRKLDLQSSVLCDSILVRSACASVVRPLYHSTVEFHRSTSDAPYSPDDVHHSIFISATAPLMFMTVSLMSIKAPLMLITAPLMFVTATLMLIATPLMITTALLMLITEQGDLNPLTLRALSGLV